MSSAAEVREALLGRWPHGEYLTVYEAPQDSSRGGTKIDVLTVSCWQSRGYSLDAVEIKVSLSDWMRERNKPAKADFWWRHVHRFWVAVPSDIAPKVRDTLPEAWGLLAVNGGKSMVVVQAPHHDPEPLPWSTCIGVMRACADAGLRAIERARQQGYKDGQEHTTSDRHGAALRETIDQQRALIKAAEAASGIPLAAWPERQAWGHASPDEILVALKAVVTDQRATKEARLALEQAEANLRRAHERVQRVLSTDEIA